MTLKPILETSNEYSDHIMVIKSMKSVGDSKRVLDEYEQDLMGLIL
jgi:myo-inositol-1-phosphate synthase